MSKVLITGITGFIGSHLAELLVKHGYEVHGIARWRSNRENLENIINNITLHDADLIDQSSLIRVLQYAKPDEIYHLAAASYVKTSFNSPVNSMMVNGIGTINLLEAVRLLEKDVKLLGITSSEVYGDVDTKNVPITEDCPFNPASPYGVSKVAQDMIILQYYKNYNIKTIRVRNFTTTGPRRGDVFFLSSFTKQAAALLLGIKKDFEIRVGNLNSIRTVCDVRDMVKAYKIIMDNGNSGDVFNVGGNITMTVGEYLKTILDIFFKERKPNVVVCPSLLRPTDVSLQIPDTKKFENISLGWKPRISIEKTIIDMVDYWKKQLEKNTWKEYTLEK